MRMFNAHEALDCLGELPYAGVWRRKRPAEKKAMVDNFFLQGWSRECSERHSYLGLIPSV